MIEILASFFGNSINLIFGFINNYGITIIFFTLLLKIILIPLGIMVQKNSIKMIKIKLQLSELKIKYNDDKDSYMEEQLALYKKEKYNPFLGLIPLIVQVIILCGLTRAIGNTNLYIPSVINTKFGIFDLQANGLNNFNFLMILIVFITSSLLCFFQNKSNVLQIEESKLNQIFTSLFTVGVIVFCSTFVPCGVSLYWTCSNLFAIFQLYLLNFLFNPKKYIDYEKLNKLKDVLNAENKEKNENKEREKNDYKRFLEAENKELVFFSEASGFIKYFEPIMNYILDNSDINIHYITSDPKDKIFDKKNDRIFKYYVGTNRLIPLFMKMDTDICVMTTPDLQNYYLKRSLVRKDVEYIFTQHGMLSCNLTYREGALDHFDTIFAIGKQQKEEVRAIEKLRNLKPKKIIETGYCLVDSMIEEYAKIKNEENEIKTVLIAPSWQEDNIMDSCLDEILENCVDKGLKIIVRPHPQYIKRNPIKMKDIIKKYQDKVNDNFIIQTDFSSSETVYRADVVITDWSAIGYEYSFTTTKPSLFINTKMKIVNPAYDEIDIKPNDILLRNVIGRSIEKDEVKNIFEIIMELINNQEKYRKINEKARNEFLYNVGHSAEISGKYIIEKIETYKNRG